MNGNPEVLALLEQLLDSSQTPEQVCRDRPELLAEVKRRWREYRFLDAEIEALFPAKLSLENVKAAGASAEPNTGLAADTSTPNRSHPARIAAIPGYEVEAVLGHGGMGIVYKARHLRLNRTVAIKMLRSGPFALPRELERFQLEAEAVAALSHENIVQIHDVGDHEGRPYLTMEFMEGGSLAQKIAGRAQPARQAALLVCALARAVQAAHDGGIIHRDLKPGNILLNASGTPKISDFGLARRLDGETGPTISGAVLGTPSYMAPEQARGVPSAMGPAVDIYALGSILYELLTGRPPFRAETSAETVLAVIADEPMAPSRRNPRVPRDLEIICLKCLRKEPERRYFSAAALADDLNRFLQGEAITARPESWGQSLARRIKRSPALSLTLAVIILMASALALSSAWLWWERQDSENARMQLDQVERARRDRAFSARLDDIRLSRTAVFEGSFEVPHALKTNKQIAALAYEAAFQEARIVLEGETAAEIAPRLRGSNIGESLAAALDDWAACTDDPKRQNWLLSIAEPAGLDPAGMRRRLCDKEVRQNPKALAGLAEEALVQKDSVRFLVFLAECLREAGGDAVAILTRVQEQHAGDFWANFLLADMHFQAGRFAESIRYFQAALALRPQAPVVYNYLGRALAHDGRWDEAIFRFRQSLAIDPTYAHAHSNLGLALRAKGIHADALQHFEDASKIVPQNGVFATNLGVGLCGVGRFDEAAKEFESALKLDASMHLAHAGLAELCERKGLLKEAIEHYRAAIRIQPAWAPHHHRLGCVLVGERLGPPRFGGPNDQEAREWGLREEAIAKLGNQGAQKRLSEAIEHFQEALRIYPKYGPALASMAEAMRTKGRFSDAIGYYEKALAFNARDKRALNGLANALEEMARPAEAIEQLKKAVDVDPNQPRFHYNLALMMSNHGRIEEAIESFRKALGLDGKFADCHGALGMALLNLGRFQEASVELDHCLDLLPKNDPRRGKIKREANRAERYRELQPRLAEIISGEVQAADAAEALEFANLCRIKKEHAAAARLFLTAFSENPELGDKLNGSRRYFAAVSATLAGCGMGADAARIKEAERERWRKQAREWLEADLTIWARVVEQSRQDRIFARTMLTHWLTNGDFAGVRGRKALAKFPLDERRQWERIWFELEQLLVRARETD